MHHALWAFWCVQFQGLTFILDNHPRAISAAQAVTDMLEGDPHSGDARKVPLYRDPHTRKELALYSAAREFKRLLTSAGLSNLATGLRCLRKGGSTALANSTRGGEHVARTMGAWRSNSYRAFVFSAQEWLNKASLAIGRDWEFSTLLPRILRCNLLSLLRVE